MDDGPYSKESITVEGRKFEVALYSDPDAGPPWENEEGHGVIREAYSGYGRPEKRPGEVILHNNRGDYWLYDLAETLKTAKRDGWGLGPEQKAELARKLGREPTKGEIVRESVQRDMDYLEGWLKDSWWYCGVCVRIIGPDGKPEGGEYDHALWRVESNGDYWQEIAEQLAGEILREKREAWRDALKEARERRFWAVRDIITTT